jgi:hypothetical protein
LAAILPARRFYFEDKVRQAAREALIWTPPGVQVIFA